MPLLMNRGVTLFERNQKQESLADLEALVHLPDAPAKNVIDAYLAISEVHWSEGRWSEGFAALDAGLQRSAREQPPYFGNSTDFIGVIFSAGLSPEGRRDKVTELLGTYARHHALPVLGEAVVSIAWSVMRLRLTSAGCALLGALCPGENGVGLSKGLKFVI